MDKEEKQKVKETFSDNYLTEYEIQGKSLLHRCCSNKMVKLLDENCITNNRKLLYCPTCRRTEKPYHVELITLPEAIL